MSAPTPTALATALRSRVEGRVLVASDDRFAADVRPVYGGFDLQPAVLVHAAHAQDVAAVVRVAAETGAELAVRSGGHSPAGHSLTDGGIVLHLGKLAGLDLDAEQRTAWAQAGLTAGAYTVAAGAHGLATGFGDTGSVGISGITLAGGLGYLSRRNGLTVDDLLAAEVVTADGSVVTADADTHPDLFWGLRGGGGNFGVVTRLKFRLHPIDKVTGGLMVLPATADVIEGFAAAADAASDDFSAIAAVMPAPPMPGVPEEAVGTLVLLAFMCHAGPADQAERAYAPFRALATPVADHIDLIPYPGMYPPEHTPGPDDEPPVVALGGRYIDQVDGAVARAVVDALDGYAGPPRGFQFRVLGGAIARVPDESTPYSHRQRRVLTGIVAFHDGAAGRDPAQAWVDDLVARIAQGAPGAYPGFLVDETGESVRQAYSPAAWARLRQVKAAYDPGNLFRRNHNVPPAGADT